MKVGVSVGPRARSLNRAGFRALFHTHPKASIKWTKPTLCPVRHAITCGGLATTNSASVIGKGAMTTVYSFWLVPEESLKNELCSIIRELATSYDASEFDPHVTIFSGPSDDDEVHSTARSITSRFSVVEFAPQKLSYTPKLTKTLFIKLFQSEVAAHLFNIIKESISQPSDYVLDPHLSLLYKTIPEENQMEICRTLRVPSGSYCFDGLRVIETEVPITRPEQIKRWRTVFEARLGHRYERLDDLPMARPFV
jgi:hypothetical protein